MTNIILKGVAILSVLGMTNAFAGEYVPKSYYLIDREGHKSDVVYIRARRSAPNTIPIYYDRTRRTVSYSSASASSSASANSGGGSGGPVYFGGEDFFPNNPGTYSNLEPNFYNQGGSGGHPGSAHSFASSSATNNAGGQGHPGGSFNYQNAGGAPIPQLFARFGEGEGSSIHASGNAEGTKGAFSSVSTSSENGKVKYSIQTGKLN